MKNTQYNILAAAIEIVKNAELDQCYEVLSQSEAMQLLAAMHQAVDSVPSYLARTEEATEEVEEVVEEEEVESEHDDWYAELEKKQHRSKRIGPAERQEEFNQQQRDEAQLLVDEYLARMSPAQRRDYFCQVNGIYSE